MQELGIVICDKKLPNQFKWAFQIFDDAEVRTHKFVQTTLQNGYLLGKIAHITVFNEFFSDQSFVKHFVGIGKPIKDHYPTERHMIKLAYVRSLAYYNQNTFHAPILPPLPGSAVTEADLKLLNLYLGLESENNNGLYVGKVLSQQLKVILDTEKMLSHHIAVLGATGTGKSYTNGVICEELLDKGVPIVIIDPHGEYGKMDEANSNQDEIQLMAFFNVKPQAYRVQESAPMLLLGEHRKSWQKSLTFDISKFDAEMLGELMGLNSGPQLDLLYLSLKSLVDNKKESYFIGDLDDTVDLIWEKYSDKKTFLTIKRRLSILSRWRIFGRSLDPKDIVKKGLLTIIDLSGDVDERIRRVVCAAVLTELFEARKRKEIPPFFVVIEEGHRFCPQDEDCASKQVIRRLAREGRKFGVGICITSQRVIGLDKDVLSQCGTKITLRIDNKSDLDYIRPYLAISYSEEFNMIPVLPQGVAIISGVAVRTPVVFKVRVRKSMHGGISAEFA